MRKTLVTMTATFALLLAGAAAAHCPAHQAGDRSMTPQADSRNGFIHTGGYGMTRAAGPDIVDTAVAAGSFDTLVKAVQAAGLLDTLKGDGPFTVFAPTDAAFAKLPDGTLEALLADPEALARVLKYHVVPGKLDAADVTGMSSLATVEGSTLPVASIRTAQTDIMTSNGIIHVIDEVLIPRS